MDDFNFEDFELPELGIEFDLDFDDQVEPEDKEKFKIESRAEKYKTRIKLKRINSERTLDFLLGDFSHEPDLSYHIISGGDIDSLSFASFLMSKQCCIEYFLFSTWCMSMPDVEIMQEWLGGKIKRIDGYVGEIFKNSYVSEWAALKKMVPACGGRMACFRNHAKIFLGWGDKFCFIVESSANINTNPRTENTVISFNPDLFFFYKDFFDGINPFNAKDFPEWKPYKIKAPAEGTGANEPDRGDPAIKSRP